MARTVAIVLVVGAVLAGCDSSGGGDARTTTSKPRTVPTFGVVLDDAGLHVSKGRYPAGRYLVSFDDRRTHRDTAQHVALGMRPSGPVITLATIPAGTRRQEILLANLVAFVAFDGVRQPSSEVPLPVDTSRAFPTPAT
jgi:hypothetical protein